MAHSKLSKTPLRPSWVMLNTLSYSLPQTSQVAMMAPPKIPKRNIVLAGNELDQVAYLIFRDRPGNVGLSNNTDQLVPINDRKTTDLMILHGLDCIVDGIIGANGDRFFAPEAAGSDVVRIAALGNTGHHDIPIS